MVMRRMLIDVQVVLHTFHNSSASLVNSFYLIGIFGEIVFDIL